ERPLLVARTLAPWRRCRRRPTTHPDRSGSTALHAPRVPRDTDAAAGSQRAAAPPALPAAQTPRADCRRRRVRRTHRDRRSATPAFDRAAPAPPSTREPAAPRASIRAERPDRIAPHGIARSAPP